MNIRSVNVERLVYTGSHDDGDALSEVAGYEHNMDVLIVKVETGNGLVGYGESLCYGGQDAVASAVEKMLAPIVLGQESSGILGLWEKMYLATCMLGRRGLVINAISGLDTALWDLLGKELGAPLYKLLGAPKRRTKGYITGGYYRKDKDIERLKEEIRGYINKGFKVVKLKFGGLPLSADIKRVAAVREEFGDSIDIAVDANNIYDLPTAIRAGRELEKLRVLFFEEPLMTDQPDQSAELAHALDLQIAGYETAYTSYEFRDLIVKHSVDIVQADASWSGGVTELMRIGAFARSFGLPLVPHYSAGGVAFVANLHVATALASPLIEYHLRPNPLREGLTGDAISYEDGFFTPPERPGLGLSGDPETVERYRVAG